MSLRLLYLPVDRVRAEEPEIDGAAERVVEHRPRLIGTADWMTRLDWMAGLTGAATFQPGLPKPRATS